jgi:hypothetical protein
MAFIKNAFAIFNDKNLWGNSCDVENRRYFLSNVGMTSQVKKMEIDMLRATFILKALKNSLAKITARAVLEYYLWFFFGPYNDFL